MLRLIGATLVVVGGFAAARILCGDGTRRCRESAACLDFLRYIRAQIDCFCLPREEIFQRYRNPVLEEAGFLPCLRQSGSIADAAERNKRLASPRVRELLEAFDGELGQSWREEQLAACDFYICRVRDALASDEAALPARNKVRRTVCIAGALMLALLFL